MQEGVADTRCREGYAKGSGGYAGEEMRFSAYPARHKDRFSRPFW
jgi:hypothetical protein